MKVSASIELIWNLAARESIAGCFPEIGAEHFLQALLKFAELPVEDLDKVAAGPDAARLLAGEVQNVRAELAGRKIESTECRRRLRAAAVLIEGRAYLHEHRAVAAEGVRPVKDAYRLEVPKRPGDLPVGERPEEPGL